MRTQTTSWNITKDLLVVGLLSILPYMGSKTLIIPSFLTFYPSRSLMGLLSSTSSFFPHVYNSSSSSRLNVKLHFSQMFWTFHTNLSFLSLSYCSSYILYHITLVHTYLFFLLVAKFKDIKTVNQVISILVLSLRSCTFQSNLKVPCMNIVLIPSF